MQILTKDQIQFADEYTIQNEPIASIDLMERAALACVNKIVELIKTHTPILVFCGKGNNGGDGFAIARLLLEKGYSTNAILVNYTSQFSTDGKVNFERLQTAFPEKIIEISDESELEEITILPHTLIIDALLGSGLNKPLDGLLKDVVKHINKQSQQVISIDCPTGLFIDSGNDKEDTIIRSGLTLSFQFPKHSFLFSENKSFVPRFEILDIGLSADLANKIYASNFFITQQDIKPLIKVRSKFSHKGTYGHALIIAGSKLMPGAALICAKACFRSGPGKVTLHSTESVLNALTAYLPEAMQSMDDTANYVANLPELNSYNVVAVGPGLAQNEETETVLKKLFSYNKAKLILDADALSILANNKTWLAFLPPETILTPHPKEFDNLTQTHTSDFERYKTAQQFVLNHKCILVLKGTYTCIFMPDGSTYYNSSGNASLAKAGSGDALTGIIAGLIAKGYTAAKACLIAVFTHGYAADLIAKKQSMDGILISDIIEKLPKAFFNLEK